ncbi:threonine-phosphate decarboxylase [Dyadobacter sp. BE34]|uniref:Aminotransferase n=1 Tax=Dyadobacter fermentans TaxID=94254 RepID=A0ABU1QTE6_9BACT|nr:MULTISPECIES: aminotransferase class I/II-fold pyridoxal phosphate-dependent enzyme [Dyadobacter]MDR6804420.1 threonine-phosphate decarboxylase [Dyadobacter fermentans]MDR7042160.1 threonine-phosphate decarboxylase [Dyadobacter sp. BE242]MDR7196562.1 threonine-phosphate decarboxylase [Dyadobacter sp. BE34]MDR7212892.1 threonine-phosphate decarboxylase [Dyadobacter sp. BE31]MDR7261969.1 threonine-phosphate decarboxylase [Dyadobacter sp. BE32]
MLHGHGDDGYRYGSKIVADFSTNVWYGGEPAGLKAYVFEKWSEINRYPEVLAESLREKIARHHQMPVERTLACSGTTESIYIIAQLFSGKRTAIVTPSFAEYEDACLAFDHEITSLSWQDALELPRLKADLVFICSPNNPTGLIFNDLQYWLKLNPQCLFAVDEAFIDFTEAGDSAISLMARFPNLLIMRSLTKTYAIPGLRLGYLLAREEVVESLMNIKQPWTVNTMAMAAGHYIYDHFDQIQPSISQLLSDKRTFVQELQKLECIEVLESDTHFFLARTLVRNAAQLKDFLIEKHGLLIRDAGNFRGLTRQHFRLATQRPEDNESMINALKEWQTLYY